MNTLRLLVIHLSTLTLLGMLPSVASAGICSSPYIVQVSGPAKIVIEPSVGVGEVLWTGSSPTAAGTGNCAGGYFTMTGEGTNRPLGNKLYETGIEGIAYRVKFTDRFSCTTDWWPSSCTSTWAPAMGSNVLTLELVKTGPITGGGVMSGRFARWVVGSEEYANYFWGASVTIEMGKPTCIAAAPPIPVALGSIPRSQFSGVGSISEAQPFNITLTCSGVGEGMKTAVSVTLTDQTKPANRSNKLTLTSQSTAQGVGIQVLKDGKPVKYGADSAEAGNTNQWLAGNTANGVFDIPLTARYIQTKEKIIAGTADGRATFTMSYE